MVQDLQTLLENLLVTQDEPDAKIRVYFQPPSNVEMNMDAPYILYAPDYEKNEFADNDSYRLTDRYLVTVVDRDPDSQIREAVRALARCTFHRYYPAEGLHHFVYQLYYSN